RHNVSAQRLIIDQAASGAWNMAVDEALLIDAAENGTATLRFYQWEEPTLSLGYFQKYDDRDSHAASRDCPTVRRQTGGGAIVHDHEITYSLSLPPSHPYARENQLSYDAVHEGIVETIGHTISTICNLEWSKWMLTLHEEGMCTADSESEHFLCFLRRSP